jgi:ubiquinone/menaquinone biosynthesis C-methylase UbiE
LVCGNQHSYAVAEQCIPVLLDQRENPAHYAQQVAYFTKENRAYAGYHVDPWMRKYIDAAVQHFGPPSAGATAVDIGAGSGYITIELARAGWQVIALDLTPASMVSLVRSAREQGVLDRITPVIGSALELPIADASVDAIVGNAVIEHLPDDNKFTAELARIAKPGARGLLVAPIKLKYVWPWFWPVNYYHDRCIGHLRRYDRKTFAALLSRHGFSLDAVQYSGHFLKVVGTLLQMLCRTHRFDEWLERCDARGARRAHGSSNITVTFNKSR